MTLPIPFKFRFNLHWFGSEKEWKIKFNIYSYFQLTPEFLEVFILKGLLPSQILAKPLSHLNLLDLIVLNILDER